ncbi:MAG: peptidase inhibitor I78 [Alphaproteobacteria bacterium]|nr:MAG: peptidase inhibitor I78 [Alphaproteobacteria bacterium]PZO34387.1 MAG: peptidase inhibitor I78 [Alphaproteobacteria bacterium]
MKRQAVILALGGALAATLAGCAMPPESVPMPTPVPVPQTCNAAASQSLIGSQVGAVSFASDANVRVVCTTCSTTRDYRPDRLNVRFDQATGRIEKVDCG